MNLLLAFISRAPVWEPDHGMMDHLLVSPVWILIGLAAVIVISALLGWKVVQHRKIWMGVLAGAIVLAGGVYVTSLLVVTEREAVMSQNRAMVQGLNEGEPFDRAALSKLFQEDIEVFIQRSPLRGRERVFNEIERRYGQYGKPELSVTFVDAKEMPDGHWLARLNIQAEVGRGEMVDGTVLEFETQWQKRGDDWQCTKITFLGTKADIGAALTQ